MPFLLIILMKLKECTKCHLCKTRTQVVCGAGNKHSSLMFIGEAPGRNEDEQGKPFVGNAGKILDEKYFGQLGINRSDVWLTNAVKCRPEKNRTPFDYEIGFCNSWLTKEIELLNPKIIVTLGSVAYKAVKMAEPFQSLYPYMMVDNPFIFHTPVYTEKDEPSVIFIVKTLHPAALIYDKNRKQDVYVHMEKLKQLIKEHI